MFQWSEVVRIQHKLINNLGRSNDPEKDSKRCNPGIEDSILRLEVYSGSEAEIENGEAVGDAPHC